MSANPALGLERTGSAQREPLVPREPTATEFDDQIRCVKGEQRSVSHLRVAGSEMLTGLLRLKHQSDSE